MVFAELHWIYYMLILDKFADKKLRFWNDISEFIKIPIYGIIGYYFLANNDIKF